MDKSNIEELSALGKADSSTTAQNQHVSQPNANTNVGGSIIKTNLCLVVKCKCGGTVAATMIYGGVEIDADFTSTVAEVYNRGGNVELVNTDKVNVTLSGCGC